MSNSPHIGAAELPCPRCGYDLRATATTGGTRRCPECGTAHTKIAGEGGPTASKIPWLHRRRRGRIRSFFATMWMALITPWRLATQTATPARFRDARRFRLIILILSTLIATAYHEYAMNRLENTGWWSFPATLFLPATSLTDRWFGAFPLIVGIYAANSACIWLYARIISTGTRPRFMHRRLLALSYYSSSLLLIQTILACIAFYGLHLLLEKGWNRYPTATFAQTLVAAGIAVIFYLLAALSLVIRTGRLKLLRVLLLLAYPVAAFNLWNVIVTAITWAVGYVVLGVRSMM